MTKVRFFSTLILSAVFLAACSPATVTQTAVAVQQSNQTPTPSVSSATPVEAIATQTASAPTALPVATSRGPDLHATDPTTVSLASGGLQFVEFFRFT